MIKFLCPGGHPLNAPENLAGKSGKCPKCNASFIVPQPDEADADGKTYAASGSAVTPAMGSGDNLAPAGEVFVFLCPNGHKLNGPPSLKGKPGQCPHCGARFLIPTDEDIENMEDEAPAEDAEQDEVPSETAIGRDGIDFNRLLGSASSQGIREEPGMRRPPAGPPGLGFIVARLWEQRTDGSELEIFLSEGEIVAPDYYSESLSTSDYGVFAVQEGDDSFAVTVIPWNTVRRVGLRRMGELPGELFQ
jgi:hypothetical protein